MLPPTQPVPEDPGQVEQQGGGGRVGAGQGVRHAYPAHPRWPSSHPRPGPSSLLGEVPVYVHVGLLNVADKGRGRLAVRVQQDGHGLFPV